MKTVLLGLLCEHCLTWSAVLAVSPGLLCVSTVSLGEVCEHCFTWCAVFLSYRSTEDRLNCV